MINYPGRPRSTTAVEGSYIWAVTVLVRVMTCCLGVVCVLAGCLTCDTAIVMRCGQDRGSCECPRYIIRMWDLVAILQNHEVPVRLLRPRNPGKVAYEVEYQVLVDGRRRVSHSASIQLVHWVP